MSKNNLKKGIVQILIANVLNMAFSIGTNFLLPKYLSIESYSQIKTYQLYLTYVAVLHFGYNDGMYLKFGGKDINEIDEKVLDENISTLKIFQLVMMIACVLVSLFVKDNALLMASIAILPQNIIAYYKNFYQATGEFKKYSRTMNLTTGLTFVINFVLLFLVRTDYYIIYLICYVILLVALWFILEYNLHKIKKINCFSLKVSIPELKENISNGALLLLGNFSSQLLTGMDRWFVKILMGSVAFAHYAFAVSMESFLNVAITPISVTMYNYFCKNNETKDIKKIRDLVVVFSVLIVSSAFPVKFILEIFLQKYLDSVNVIFILFSAQIFYIIIKSVYVNLYKARKQQKKYFSKLCIILVLGIIFNIICYGLYPRKEAFAIGTLLSSVVWFFLSSMDFKELKYEIRHYIFLFTELIAYLVLGILFNSIIGFTVYILITLIMIKFCIPSAYTFLFQTLKKL